MSVLKRYTIITSYNMTRRVNIGIIPRIINARLKHHGVRPIVLPKCPVSQSSYPDLDPMLPSELILSHENMNAPVKIAGSVTNMSTQDVFLHPIQLKISKRLAIPHANS